jgi:hypothetical protein
MNSRFFRSKAFESLINFYRVIEQIIEEGKAQGAFRSEGDKRVF